MEAKPRISTLTTAEKEIVRIVPQRFRGAVEQILEGGRADEIRFIIDRPMQAAFGFCTRTGAAAGLCDACRRGKGRHMRKTSL